MIYYVEADAPRGGDGSEKRPFQRINDAAKIAKAGDQVLVAPGIYREYVNPVHGGEENSRIIYRSREPLAAVITGSESGKGLGTYEGNVWMARIPNGISEATIPTPL